jgi:hypothetical protein
VVDGRGGGGESADTEIGRTFVFLPQVILMHPLMLHSASHNNLRIPRIITNPPVSLLSPFNFHRTDSEYSLVEMKTILSLGGTKETGIEFKPTCERERVVPDRLKFQSVMMEEEKERLRKMGMEMNIREKEGLKANAMVAA